MSEQKLAENVDWFSWFWKILGGTCISLIAVLVLAIFSNLNANLQALSAIITSNQSDISQLKSEIATLKDNQERLRTLTTKFQDTNKVDIKDVQKVVQEFQMKVVAIEERGKLIDERLKGLEAKTEKKEESR